MPSPHSIPAPPLSLCRRRRGCRLIRFWLYMIILIPIDSGITVCREKRKTHTHPHVQCHRFVYIISHTAVSVFGLLQLDMDC